MAITITNWTPQVLAAIDDEVRRQLYAQTIDEKRRSILLAAGSWAPDLPIGNRGVGFYNRVTRSWSEPSASR